MDLLKSLNQPLLDLPRWAKRAVLWAIDLAALPICFMAAYMLRFSKLPDIPTAWYFLILAPAFTVLFLQLSGFYRVVVRYIDFNVLKAILAGLALAVMVLYSIAYLADVRGTPRSIFVIYGALAGAWLLVSRLLAREYLRWSTGARVGRIPVVIFGAGSAGMQTASSLKHENQYEPMAFIDDSPSLRGQLVSGLPVFGRGRFPRWLARNPEVKTVLMAMPSVSDDQRRDALQFIQPLGLAVKTLPGLADLVSGKAKISEISDVNVSDLLSRSEVGADSELMQQVITGSSVMVTGAGGSIGSELCRQIVRLKPKTLVLFEISEFALYQIEQNLLKYLEAAEVRIVPVLGSVLDRPFVGSVLRRHGVQTVFHAAAYKHVPLVESNVAAGVRNNVMGTLAAAEAALEQGVKRFILVSTDKAVRPTNVMGASKRVAEMTLQSMSSRGAQTVFAMVRFGNVLDSSGSVVPRFRMQIYSGGPVTVTHPDITRYFMTIPEAANLVIQAGAMAKGGEVYLLDMGEPVKIDRLARTMIQLMGRTVRDENGDGDIEIRYSGLRPGEKLYEELLIDAEADPTEHPKIFKAHESHPDVEAMHTILAGLSQACERLDIETLRLVLSECVEGYTPDSCLVDPFARSGNDARRDGL